MSAGVEEFAKLLVDLRIDNFSSQHELATKVGISDASLSRYEAGLSLPRKKIFEVIVSILRNAKGEKVIVDQLEAIWTDLRHRKGLAKSTFTPKFSHNLSELVLEFGQDPLDGSAFLEDLKRGVEKWKRYRIGYQAMVNGDTENARKFIDKLLGLGAGRNKPSDEFLDSLDDFPHLKMRVITAKAHLLRYEGQTRKAIDEWLPLAIKIAEKIGVSAFEFLINILVHKGDFHRRLGEPKTAEVAYDKAAIILDENVNDTVVFNTWQAKIHRKIAGTYLFEGLPQKALELSNLSLSICGLLNDDYGKIKAMQHIAWANAMLGDYNHALSIHKRILREIKKTKVRVTELAKEHRYYADILRMCNLLGKAEINYGIARKLLRENATPTLEESETLQRGPITFGQAQISRKRGIEHASKTLSLLQESMKDNENDVYYRALTLSELGWVSVLRKAETEGLRFFDLAQRNFKELGNEYYVAAMDINKAECELVAGQPEKAIEILNKLFATMSDENSTPIHKIRARAILLRVGLDIPDLLVEAADSFFTVLQYDCINTLGNGYICYEVLNSIKADLKNNRMELQKPVIRDLLDLILHWKTNLYSDNKNIKKITNQGFDDIVALLTDPQ